jgi:hypothetical protein
MDSGIRDLIREVDSGNLSAIYPLTAGFLRAGRLLDACQLGRHFQGRELHKWRIFLASFCNRTLPVCELMSVIQQCFDTNSNFLVPHSQDLHRPDGVRYEIGSQHESVFRYELGFRSSDISCLIPGEWLEQITAINEMTDVIGYIPHGTGFPEDNWIYRRRFENPGHLDIEAALHISLSDIDKATGISELGRRLLGIIGEDVEDDLLSARGMIIEQFTALGEALLNYGWYAHPFTSFEGPHIVLEPLRAANETGLNLIYHSGKPVRRRGRPGGIAVPSDWLD